MSSSEKEAILMAERLAIYLKEYQKEHKLSLRQFSERIGCSFAYLRQLLNVKNPGFSFEILQKIANATSIPISELIKKITGDAECELSEIQAKCFFILEKIHDERDLEKILSFLELFVKD